MFVVNQLLRKCFPHIGLCIADGVTAEESRMLKEVNRILLSKRYEIASKVHELSPEEHSALLNGQLTRALEDYAESLVSLCAKCFPDLRRELILDAVRTQIIIEAVRIEP